MFDENYVEIPGTNPVQHRTRILDWADRALPPFQEAFLARDPRMAFCAMIDRNGYLPVHNKIYSHPQRPGDVAWNTANSRNRRIFNDPAGLAAGRNLRSYLIQSYARDMGNGKTVMMREIDVPIRVNGRTGADSERLQLVRGMALHREVPGHEIAKTTPCKAGRARLTACAGSPAIQNPGIPAAEAPSTPGDCFDAGIALLSALMKSGGVPGSR